MNTNSRMDQPLFVKGDHRGNLLTLVMMAGIVFVLVPLMYEAATVLGYAYLIFSLSSVSAV